MVDTGDGGDGGDGSACVRARVFVLVCAWRKGGGWSVTHSLHLRPSFTIVSPLNVPAVIVVILLPARFLEMPIRDNKTHAHNPRPNTRQAVVSTYTRSAQHTASNARALYKTARQHRHDHIGLGTFGCA